MDNRGNSEFENGATVVHEIQSLSIPPVVINEPDVYGVPEKVLEREHPFTILFDEPHY